MARLPPIVIDNIFGGISAVENFNAPGQYQSGFGIDPDMPVDDSAVLSSGFLRPTSLAKFSSTTVTAVPLWMVTNPKDSNVYVYAADGKLHSVSSALGMNSDVGTLTSAAGNGLEYYDNYIYAAKNTDISRHGPLNGSPSVTASYWQTTLGKSALTNNTYPSLNGITLPNHPIYRMEAAGKLFIADVASDNRGVIHFIRTTKTTVEGDTDNGSSANSLYLPYGYWPNALTSIDTRLVIAAFEGTNGTIKQARAKLFFWDTTTVNTYQNLISVEFPDPYITAIKNVNGVLYVFSGNLSGGYRVSRLVGAYSFEEVAYHDEGYSPLPGAVDGELNRIIYGSSITDPEAAAVVWAYGSKKQAIGQGRHAILKASASTGGHVTALKFVEHASSSKLRPIVGWKDNSAYGLDKISTTYGTSVWRSPVYRIGQEGQLKKIRIPLGQAVAANMTLTVKVYVDNRASSTTVATINNTNYPNSERQIVLNPEVSFKHSFFIELRWTGTALLTVGLPMTAEVEIDQDC